MLAQKSNINKFYIQLVIAFHDKKQEIRQISYLTINEQILTLMHQLYRHRQLSHSKKTIWC